MKCTKFNDITKYLHFLDVITYYHFNLLQLQKVVLYVNMVCVCMYVGGWGEGGEGVMINSLTRSVTQGSSPVTALPIT